MVSGQKIYRFIVSEGGGKAMAIAFTRIKNVTLNQVDPQTWLTLVLDRIADQKSFKSISSQPCAFAH